MTRIKYTCRECKINAITVLEPEDIEDGCRDGTLLCDMCISKRTKGLTKEDVILAMKGTK